MNEIRYRQALNREDRLITVEEAESGGSYTCPGCRSRLLFRSGPKNQSHFSHYQEACSYETYLHKAAKLALGLHFRRLSMIQAAYQIKIFDTMHSIHVGTDEVVSTGFSLERHSHDILAEQPQVTVEPEFGGFRPDILLEGPYLTYFVEICVTHPVTAEKIESGIPIIEIHIFREEDIHKFLAEDISEGGSLRLYNFEHFRHIHRRNLPMKQENATHAHLANSGAGGAADDGENGDFVQFRDQRYECQFRDKHLKHSGVVDLTPDPESIVRGRGIKKIGNRHYEFYEEIQEIYAQTKAGDLKVLYISEIEP